MKWDTNQTHFFLGSDSLLKRFHLFWIRLKLICIIHCDDHWPLLSMNYDFLFFVWIIIITELSKLTACLGSIIVIVNGFIFWFLIILHFLYSSHFLAHCSLSSCFFFFYHIFYCCLRWQRIVRFSFTQFI